ncbi:MAG: hypothetical protein JW740_03520, partial [Candidatus Zambryskibacteria bacterium]|nr:hypothetical protein [Candidatus Zambryskibacteria bacterium]
MYRALFVVETSKSQTLSKTRNILRSKERLDRLYEALSGKTLKIVLDQGPTLEYKFESKDKLTFSEG